MYGCYGENVHVIHLWELKGKRKIVSRTKEKLLAVVPFCLFFPIGKKGTESATQLCNANNKLVMFLKLQPGL